MAQLIQFGDGNPVTELDFGLPGGALHGTWPATGASSALTISQGGIAAPSEEAAMPDTNLVAVQRGGFHGQTLSVSGVLHAVDMDTLKTIIAEIRKREFDPELNIPTTLTNNNTGETLTEVTLRNFRETAPREVAAGGTVLVPIAFEFRVHRRAIS